MQPLLIAHRGASGYRPEHTLAAYDLAIDMGADFIEPDLVLTRDGVFIARHENALALVEPAGGQLIEATTNVHTLARFAARRCSKRVDGKLLAGWFAEDFTLDEIKQLRARERIPHLRPQNARYDDCFEIPTLQEAIDLARRRSAELGRTIGIYPETKHPSHHAAAGLPMEDRLVQVLEANDWNRRDAPVFIQSFEVANLRCLRGLTRVRLVQLMEAAGQPWDLAATGDPATYADMATARGLEAVARYADAVGPAKAHVVPTDAHGRLREPASFVRDAHAAGLLVHPWTFRAENAFLPADCRRGGDPAAHGCALAEMRTFLRAGIDGFFTDHADLGAAARTAFHRQG
jgi:glycerophosphoryl diester phosphodiesterase